MAGRRINGGIIGVVNSATGSVAKGIWSTTEQVLSRKGGNWPDPPPPPPTWDYDPMNTFSVYNTSGSFVQSSTEIYLTGASYDGGYKGAAVAPTAFKALQNSWNLDFQLNRVLDNNGPPFTNYAIAITRQSSASSFFSSPGAQDIVNWNGGNGENYFYYVRNGNNSQLYSVGSNMDNPTYSALTVAGASARISFDHTTFTFTFYGRADGSFSGMTQVGTYTLSAGEKSSMESSYLNTDFYINSVYRGNNDGFRNISWYTV